MVEERGQRVTQEIRTFGVYRFELAVRFGLISPKSQNSQRTSELGLR